MGELALILLSVAWGTTFTIVDRVLASTSPGVFLSLRFAVATLVLGLAYLARGRRPATPGLLRHGVLSGLAMAGGFIFQTEGLRLTTAARSGFLTAFYVLGVPLLARGLYGRAIPRSAWAGIALATAGLAVLSGGGAATEALRIGDLLTMLCAVSYAFQIVLVAEWSRRHDLLDLTLIQLAVTLGASLILAAAEQRQLAAGPGVFGAVAFTGIFMTAGAFLVQNWAQRHVPAVRAALIYALEPVSAALFARFVGGDPLPPLEWLGGGMVIVGVVIGELWPLLPRRAPTSPGR